MGANYEEAAIDVVKHGPSEIPKRAIISRFGRLIAFTEPEKEQFAGVLGLIERYIQQSAPKHPLCIGAFGPPGSGKSFSVEELVATAVESANKQTGSEARVAMPLRTFNLTQIPSTRDLSQLLGQSIVSEKRSVPVLFFDEFDAPLGGSPLGWLSWFLAPMHDGQFQLRGTTIPLRRAVYVFAGGTSSTFAEFAGRTDVEFRNAKGPDFVSRLRGTLDVCGPNERSARALRRAVILWKSLKDRHAALLGSDSDGALKMSPTLIRGFLDAGRFRHGARSIGAIVEMCNVEGARVTGLPTEHLLRSHVDRGRLDPREVGGGIGLSAGGTQTALKGAWKRVANTLWEQGATIVYGGHAREGGLTQLLKRELERLPSGPLHPRKKGSPPYLRWIDRTGDASVSAGLRRVVKIDPVPKLVMPLRADLAERIRVAADGDSSIEGWLSKSVGLFRMRHQMNGQCVARVTMGGTPAAYTGRFPGVLEETLLALHSGQPVYVVGGFGGAAAGMGEIMGLGRASVKASEKMLKGPARLASGRAESALAELSDLLGADEHLPRTFGDAVDDLWRHAIGGPGWIDNGLSRQENRRLFESTDAVEICDLVVRGIVAALE